MNVEALIFSITNWEFFNETCKKQLQVSPIKTLIESGYRKEEPCAFAGVLPLSRTPISNLTDLDNPFFQHTFCGFLVQVDERYFKYIIGVPPQWNIVDTINEQMILIMSGTLRQWIQQINSHCKKDANKHARLLANKCLETIRASGFKVWENKKRIKHEDGTFTMELESR